MGEMLSSPDSPTIEQLLTELDQPLGAEHPGVALTHESGWSLEALPGGGLTWENDVDGDAPDPRHRDAVPRDEVRRLWSALAGGHLAEIETQQWLPGYK